MVQMAVTILCTVSAAASRLQYYYMLISVILFMQASISCKINQIYKRKKFN